MFNAGHHFYPNNNKQLPQLQPSADLLVRFTVPTPLRTAVVCFAAPSSSAHLAMHRSLGDERRCLLLFLFLLVFAQPPSSPLPAEMRILAAGRTCGWRRRNPGVVGNCTWTAWGAWAEFDGLSGLLMSPLISYTVGAVLHSSFI